MKDNTGEILPFWGRSFHRLPPGSSYAHKKHCLGAALEPNYCIVGDLFQSATIPSKKSTSNPSKITSQNNFSHHLTGKPLEVCVCVHH